MELGVLRFEEGYIPRIWGGRKLEGLLGKPLPPDGNIGEAWLIADHAVHESVVAEGPHRGRTLHDLVTEHPQALLGRLASPTPFGRFPLLLKLLDAREVLSVQVHPDDACAKRLGEPDAGKTEMWYVLDAEPGSELICGLDPGLAPEAFVDAVRDGSIARRVCRYPVHAGSALLVPAGVVHALGAGVVLAEIQQNSNLTYRLYDWERTDANGVPRSLHVEKALAAIHFGERHPGLADCGLRARRDVLAACPYFAAERIEVEGVVERLTHGDSFHIVLAVHGAIEVEGVRLRTGEAALVPAECPLFRVSGTGVFLDYYVPEL
jgi:mannose-6-phosphate isomerase